jgi:hypothetical protein
MGTAPKKAFAGRKIQLANILVATDFSPVSHRPFSGHLPKRSGGDPAR